MRPIGCPETSATNYQSTLRNITEGRAANLHRDRSLESNGPCLGRCWDFETAEFLWDEDFSPTPVPNLEGQGVSVCPVPRSKPVRYGWPYHQLGCTRRTLMNFSGFSNSWNAVSLHGLAWNAKPLYAPEEALPPLRNFRNFSSAAAFSKGPLCP
jgi:hypothetical protein